MLYEEEIPKSQETEEENKESSSSSSEGDGEDEASEASESETEKEAGKAEALRGLPVGAPASQASRKSSTSFPRRYC